MNNFLNFYLFSASLDTCISGEYDSITGLSCTGFASDTYFTTGSCYVPPAPIPTPVAEPVAEPMAETPISEPVGDVEPNPAPVADAPTQTPVSGSTPNKAPVKQNSEASMMVATIGLVLISVMIAL